MRAMVIGCLILAACSGAGQWTERPLQAEDMPASFGYGSLARAEVDYKQTVDGNRGATLKRMRLRGQQGEWAIVDVQLLIGDYVLTSTDPKVEARYILKPDLDVHWGESGTVRGAGQPTAWQAFTFAGSSPQACVVLARSLREHWDAGPAGGSQELVTAVYCRSGERPINAAEMPSIAGALQTRG